jgi:hypothetical protein
MNLSRINEDGEYTGHPMDPRTPEPTEEDDRREAISTAILKLQCAQEANERGGNGDAYAVEARGLLNEFFPEEA